MSSSFGMHSVKQLRSSFSRAHITSIPERNVPSNHTCVCLCRRFSSLPSTAGRPCNNGTTASRSKPNSSVLSRESIFHRPFSTSPKRSRWGIFKTVEEAEARYKSGPFSFRAGLLFLFTGVGLYSYFTYEKGRMERLRTAESHKAVGKARIGGEFTLTDHNGNTVTDKDLLLGKYSLVYFGFTHCPDICPEELDKMAEMIDAVYAKRGKVLRPIFITCDPARDNPKVMKAYLKEFHDSFIGLTGTYDEIKDICKKYRVYFSTPRDLKEGMDYLVDHSIYFYLMDPEGHFVEALGRQHTAQRAASIIETHIGDWRGKLEPDP